MICMLDPCFLHAPEDSNVLSVLADSAVLRCRENVFDVVIDDGPLTQTVDMVGGAVNLSGDKLGVAAIASGLITVGANVGLVGSLASLLEPD